MAVTRFWWDRGQARVDNDVGGRTSNFAAHVRANIEILLMLVNLHVVGSNIIKGDQVGACPGSEVVI